MSDLAVQFDLHNRNHQKPIKHLLFRILIPDFYSFFHKLVHLALAIGTQAHSEIQENATVALRPARLFSSLYSYAANPDISRVPACFFRNGTSSSISASSALLRVFQPNSSGANRSLSCSPSKIMRSRMPSTKVCRSLRSSPWLSARAVISLWAFCALNCW